MGIIEEKNALRREIKKRLKNISLPENESGREKKNSTIAQNIKELLKKLYPSQEIPFSQIVLGAYAPMRDEVDPLTLKESVQNWAFPDIDDGRMVFRQCRLEELIETEEFGVRLRTPPKSAKIIVPQVLLIPGLAFTKEGKRLGRGKGFYDRYLEQFQGVTVAAGYSEQIEDDIPTDDHDVLVDYVVSESGIFGDID